MKSINYQPETKHVFDFSDEILKHILNEGFILGINNSYCHVNTGLPNTMGCYTKTIYVDGYDISIYIFGDGIGIDIDYSCGGNSYNFFWSFSEYDFESAYDNMVDCLERYK